MLTSYVSLQAMHLISSLFFRCLLAGFLLSPALCFAALPTLREATSVRAAGMGGATRGFAEGTDAIWVNPAAIAATPRFSLSAEYLMDRHHNMSLLSGGAVDSRINAGEGFELSGGFSYNYYQSGAGEQARKGSLLCTSLSLPLYPNFLFAGITAKYFNLSGAVKSSATTMDAAIMIQPVSLIKLSGIGYNLVDIGNPEAQRSWGFGLAIGKTGAFYFDVDLHLEKDFRNQQILSYGAGAEYSISDLFVLRAGYWDDRLREARLLGGGFSVVYSGLAFDFSYQQGLKGPDRRFGFALRLVDWMM